MSVYKPAKSKYFQFDFVWQGHRYHGSTGCASRRDAERYEREQRRKAVLGDDTKPSITTEEATGLWWEAKGKHLRSEATVIYQLDNLANGLGRSRPIADVVLRDLDEYIARRRASVSNASVNRETALFRRVVNFCEARGYDVPQIAWRETKLKEAALRTRVLTRDEEARLFAALPESIKPLVEFALLSGQRKTEVVRLRWSDVDLVAGRASVWAKGQRPHSLPLTPRLIALIANQPKAGPFVFTYIADRDAPQRKDRVARVKGERYPFSPQGWDRKWRKAVKDAGLEGYTFHSNRHTALSRTGSIEAANRLAGHTEYRTTKRYFHTDEDVVRAAMIAAESRTIPEPEEAMPENERKSA